MNRTDPTSPIVLGEDEAPDLSEARIRAGDAHGEMAPEFPVSIGRPADVFGTVRGLVKPALPRGVVRAPDGPPLATLRA